MERSGAGRGGRVLSLIQSVHDHPTDVNVAKSGRPMEGGVAVSVGRVPHVVATSGRQTVQNDTANVLTSMPGRDK